MKIKDQLKLYVFPKLIVVLNKLGISWEKLGSYTFFSKSILFAQAKKLGSINITKNDSPQEFYVLLMLSGSMFHLVNEALLALGLKEKGHKVTFIIDDNTLPIHELKRINDEGNWDYTSERDYIFAAKLLKKLNLEYIPISEFIKDDLDGIEYNDRFDNTLEATLLKHYRVGVLSDDLFLVKEKKERTQRAIAITEYIGKKLVSLSPDAVIMSHGIYSTWGPPFEILDENNINVLVHGRGKKRFSQVYNWNKTGDSWDVSGEWEKVKNKDLTDTQLNQVNDYLKSRIMHSDDAFVFNHKDKTTNNETFQFLGLDPNKKTYSLFTNVLWDAASAQREIAFKNPVEWVVETIEWFNRHPEKQLIVKIHPAEELVGTNMPFNDVILSKITPSANVRIIKPDEKINSWSVYDITDLGMVHTTTSGMELPLVYKPCIVVSKTHYRNKGFTIDVNSKEEYFKLIENYDATTIDFEKNKKEALKYAYLLFIRYQVPFNMFYEDISTDIRGFRKESLADYIKDKMFNNIIRGIENRTPIFYD